MFFMSHNFAKRINTAIVFICIEFVIRCICCLLFVILNLLVLRDFSMCLVIFAFMCVIFSISRCFVSLRNSCLLTRLDSFIVVFIDQILFI